MLTPPILQPKVFNEADWYTDMAVSVDFITCALSHYSWLTLVFPFPWTTTGRESYAVFLTLTRSVPNLRSTSSARRRKTRCLRRQYEKLTNHMDMLCCRGFFFYYLKSTRPRQEHNTGDQWSATKVSPKSSFLQWLGPMKTCGFKWLSVVCLTESTGWKEKYGNLGFLTNGPI